MGGPRSRADVPPDIPAPVARVWRRVKDEGLTYLSNQRLESLVRLAMEFESKGQPGLFVEAGCALGGSALLLTATKAPERPLRVYDVFDMIPPPGENDGADVHERYQIIKSGQSKGIRGATYYGYEDGLYEKVAGSFETYGLPLGPNHVSLIKGLVQDTLTGDETVCLAHVDVDWFDPVMCCLERLVPRLCPGGVIVLDDYGDWSGCRRAVDGYFETVGRQGFDFDMSAGHLVIRREP